MNSATTPCVHGKRAGITVLEVLISIGILAVGLTSVLALVPAAKSQSAKAVILDRGAALAANVLADAATFGLLRSGTQCFMMQAGGGGWVAMAARPELMLVTTTTSGSPALNAGTVTSGTVSLKATGVFGSGTTVVPPAYLQSILQLRDDIIVTSGTGDDSPTNLLVDGVRAFEGRMSSVLIISGTSLTLTPLHRASVIVFHSRDPSTLLMSGTLLNGTLTMATGDRSITDIVRPGVVVNVTGTLHQLTAATVKPLTDSTAAVFLGSAKEPVIDTATPPGLTIQFFPDSVGLAERTFIPESPGLFTQ